MSRIGKKLINIPQGTTVNLDGNTLTIKGPLGAVSKKFKPNIEIKFSEGNVVLNPQKLDNFSKALWGTYASHIFNMIEGVNKPFEKKLVLEGVGYRSELKGDKLVMSLGFSYPLEVNIPKDIKVLVEKENITVSGVNKEEVGQFAAKLRSFKKPEPYKGKGMRYADEVIRRKQGKRSV
jgi:large subunit ribosomal protein L6